MIFLIYLNEYIRLRNKIWNKEQFFYKNENNTIYMLQ